MPLMKTTDHPRQMITDNPWVVGSSPTRPTKVIIFEPWQKRSWPGFVVLRIMAADAAQIPLWEAVWC
jgi:hypothetical protein